MQEIAKEYLKEKKKLYKKYLKAEKNYYKKIGDKYETISLDIDLDENTLKRLFVSLANTNICFDDFVLCLIKTEIVRKEMEKNEKAC